MTKYKVIRIWEIEAKNITEAITKTKNWKHYSVNVEKTKPNPIMVKRTKIKWWK